MEYMINLEQFEGPLDLLLHLIKQSQVQIYDIKIEEIAKQYLDTIHKMEQLNLDIASEYLVMAAELIEMKSKMLLPKKQIDETDEYEEDPREKLIEKLLEYKTYKETTKEFHTLEEERKNYFTKQPTILNPNELDVKPNLTDDLSLDDLLQAFAKFLEKKQADKPLNTKITTKEYSVAKRETEIRYLLKQKKTIKFEELFDIVTKEYIVVTFLSILDLARKQELIIQQHHNFDQIVLSTKEA